MHYGEWLEPIPVENKDGSLGEMLARWFREGKPYVATAYMRRSAANVAHMGRILAAAAEKNGGQELKGQYKKDAEYYQEGSDHIANIYDRYLIRKDGTIDRDIRLLMSGRWSWIWFRKENVLL